MIRVSRPLHLSSPPKDGGDLPLFRTSIRPGDLRCPARRINVRPTYEGPVVYERKVPHPILCLAVINHVFVFLDFHEDYTARNSDLKVRSRMATSVNDQYPWLKVED